MPIPIGRRVLIKLDREEKEEKLKLILQEEKPTTGVVKFLGTSPDFSLKVGDRVFIGKNYPEEIEIEKEKYIMVPEEGLVKI